jgi:DNA-binding response OmpR family regulator
MACLGSALIVDDEETFRESTCRLLRREGFDCQGAGSADEALTILQKSRFDVMIADICMPGNSDLRVVRGARELDQQLAVILVTGYPSMETAVPSVELSVAAYLVKPLDFEELLRRVTWAITHSQNRRVVDGVRERLQTCLADLDMVQSKPMRRADENDAPVAAGTIRTLACCLSQLLDLCARLDGGRHERDLCELLHCPERPGYRAAIADTIDVLKKTKESFKSKALGELRAKLENLLGPRETLHARPDRMLRFDNESPAPGCRGTDPRVRRGSP